MIKQEIAIAIKACVLTLFLCSVSYPALVWGAAQLLFPHEAEGSLIFGDDGRMVIGSQWIAQRFESDRYFHSRPSAVDYKADAAGGSNLGPNSPDLREAVGRRAKAIAATVGHPAPVDLVTASGSGLDPDLSPDAIYYQSSRVAAARGLTVDVIHRLVDQHVNRSGKMIGAPARVNVLGLNLALDGLPDRAQ
jgi:K+-transporting ATPase ATPase C chain